jgi:hypothetical protein
MVKAPARALRWRKLLQTGIFGTIAEIAAAAREFVPYFSPPLKISQIPRRAYGNGSLLAVNNVGFPSVQLTGARIRESL